MPVRGNRLKISHRMDFSPELRPSQNGELVVIASMCGKK
jgi:hypothetical protein